MKHPIYLIAAADTNLGIGINNTLPWRLPEDLKHFNRVTSETEASAKRNMVIMGRKTWESLPEKFRPLPKRRNVVITRQEGYEAKGARVVHSIDDAIAEADHLVETIFVIGGAEIYKQSITHEDVSGIYLTHVYKDFECDAFFPVIPPDFSQQKSLGSHKEGDLFYEFMLYTK